MNSVILKKIEQTAKKTLQIEASAVQNLINYIKPDFARAHYNLGLLYFLVGNKGSALEEYGVLKTLDHDLANQLFNKIYK